MADNRKKRITGAQNILTAFGLPAEQRKELACPH
jgi:hypothetical protein